MQEMSANGTEVSWSDVGKVLDDEMSSIEDIQTDLVRNDMEMFAKVLIIV